MWPIRTPRWSANFAASWKNNTPSPTSFRYGRLILRSESSQHSPGDFFRQFNGTITEVSATEKCPFPEGNSKAKRICHRCTQIHTDKCRTGKYTQTSFSTAFLGIYSSLSVWFCVNLWLNSFEFIIDQGVYSLTDGASASNHVQNTIASETSAMITAVCRFRILITPAITTSGHTRQQRNAGNISIVRGQ